MAVMGLGIKQGETITVTVEGDDETARNDRRRSFRAVFLCYAIKMTAARPLTHLIQGIIIEVWQSLSKSRSEESMDHSHHERTYKKSRFQQELEQSVSRKLISSLLLGCLFCTF